MDQKEEVFIETNGSALVALAEECAPDERFRVWVYKFGGTKKLSRAINVHQNSVQGWLARRSRPSLDAILAMLRLSVGELSLKDIDLGTKAK